MNPKVKRKLMEFVEEDIGFGDITSEIVPDVFATGKILAKRSCILAGIEEVSVLYDMLGCETEKMKDDGTSVKKEVVLEVFGPAKKILVGERVSLNLLSRMSGIATSARRVYEHARKVNPEIKVVGTRKTCPGFTYFDKKAIRIGTGSNHRFNLSDAILIKNNHLQFFGVQRAINLARQKDWVHKVEIEVSDMDEALTAVKSGADIVMLDNFSPSDVRKTIAVLKKAGLREKCLIEASGGINYGNVQDYAKHVDIVSLGALTHSVTASDFSLYLEAS